MSIFKRLAVAVRGDSRAAHFEQPGLISNGFNVSGTHTHAGETVTQDRALTHSAVYAAVSLISDSVAGLPVDVIRTVGDQRKPVAVPAWLSKPNPWDTRYDFLHKVLTSLLMDGNAFLQVFRNDAGKIVALIPIEPRYVSVELQPDLATVGFRVAGELMGPDQILHIKGFSTAGSLRGLSPIDHMRETIGLGLAAEEHGSRFFGQGSTMAGIVEHPGKPSPGETAVLAKMLRKNHSGLKNSHAVGVLTGGATWKSISVTPEASQFLETTKANRISIASVYRIPPHMIDPSVQSSWGSGTTEQNRNFVTVTLLPWITRLEEAFSSLLPAGQTVSFNVDARLRATTAERYAAYKTALEAGFMTVEEVRALEDLGPIGSIEPPTTRP